MPLRPLRTLTFLLFVTISVCGQTPLDRLVTETVERARQEFNVPGMAVAVVHDGKVLLARGFGVRKLGESAAVTPDTLFGIASNSKAFTSAALAMLVDDGKLAWDDRVIDRLPEFALSDAYVTREMRIRDLLCHRSGLGLGAGDLMFFPRSDLTPEQILYRLRFVPLATSFRSEYAYDNVLYLVAGAVIQKISGLTWQQFIRQRFYQPLGMDGSRTSINDVSSSDDVAYPHAMTEGKLTTLPLSSLALDNNAPAGALVSSVADLSKWVIALLNRGQTGDGKRLITEAQMKELWTPLILLHPPDPPAPIVEARSNFVTYAMGEMVRDYRGRLMITHTGGLQGMVTQVTMIPDLKLGVIVLTNQEVGAAFSSVSQTVIDHHLSAPPKDWVAAYAQVKKNREAEANKAVADAAAKRNAQSTPSLPLASYAGRYRDSWYGDVVIEMKGNDLVMRFTHSPALSGALEHWQFNTFIARWTDRSLLADAYVTFTLDPDGAITGVKMKAVSPLTDFSFDFHDLALGPAPVGSPPRE